MLRTKDLDSFTLPADATVGDVAEHLERTKVAIVLIVDGPGRLVGTVTDGDLRRAHLSASGSDSKISEIMSRKPITALEGTDPTAMEEVLRRHRIQDLPVVDADGHPIGIFSLRGQASRTPRSFAVAVVMAGGEGQRLRPLTDSVPKPLVPFRDRPLLEHVLERLEAAGINKVFVSVNYKGEMIREHIGDGARFDLSVEYLEESSRLGTAGGLSLLPEAPRDPLLVVNADILTDVDYGLLWAFHVKHRSAMTVGAVEYVAEIPYGKLELANHFLLDIQEKPEVRFQCAAGIYVLEPEVLDLMPEGEAMDMPELIRALLQQGLPVGVFPIQESWLEIGTLADLEKEHPGKLP